MSYAFFRILRERGYDGWVTRSTPSRRFAQTCGVDTSSQESRRSGGIWPVDPLLSSAVFADSVHYRRAAETIKPTNDSIPAPIPPNIRR